MKEIYFTIGLRIAGLILLGLVLANYVASKRLKYAYNLKGSATMVRQIFYVHCAYIIVIVSALALLCLGWPELLLKDGLGRVMSGFFGLFWFSRVVVQLTYYDREVRRQERAWDVFFLIIFLLLSTVFTVTALQP